MRTLSCYLVRELARTFLSCWLGLAAVFLVIEFLGKLDDLLSAHVAPATVALYLATGIPQALCLIAPLSALLATVVTVEMLARNNELMAMQALGIPPRALLLPGLAAAVAFTLALGCLSEVVAPLANRTAATIWDARVAGKPHRKGFAAARTWCRGEGAVYSFRWCEEDGRTFHGVTIYQLARDFGLSRRVDARRAHYLGGGLWDLTDGMVQRQATAGFEVRPFLRLRLRLPEPPPDLADGQRPPEEMSALEMYRFATSLEREGYDASRFLVDVQSKLAFVIGAAVLAVLGLVFSLRGHPGGMAAAIGFAILAAFAFWVSQTFFASLGRTGILPWWLAPWVADAVFTLATVWLWNARPAAARRA
ncbi:MAG: LptF/LptG family permease [Pseudomonadota bacterium]